MFALKKALDQAAASGYYCKRMNEGDAKSGLLPSPWVGLLPEYQPMLELMKSYSATMETHVFWADLEIANNIQEMKQKHDDAQMATEMKSRGKELSGLAAKLQEYAGIIKKMKRVRGA